MKFNEAKKIHLIGIGGIGISAIAKLLVARGLVVSGSDQADSEIVRETARAGVKIMIGHQAENIEDAELVIYSEAVPRDNPERVAAREHRLPEYSGAEALAEITRGQRLLAVAGTHGKSTTTALLGLMLEAGGLDPTVIVGSKVASFSLGNARVGQSKWFVLEADEYQAKFLQLSPEFAIVTNIEEDHIDYYKDPAHLHETFQKFLDQVSRNGRIFLDADDPQSMDDLSHRREFTTYGIKNQADFQAKNIQVSEGQQKFEVYRASDQSLVGKFSLQIPGQFNVMNALAALTAALEVGVSVDAIKAVLGSFKGLWRRFEKVGERDGAIIISDYGHHPTAVRSTLEAAREFYPDHRIVLIFQPHQHHRAKTFFKEFVASFAGADVLILSDVYRVAGRDEGEEVGSENLAQSARASGMKEVHYAGNVAATKKLARELIQKNDLVMVMGAGDVDVVARNLVAS